MSRRDRARADDDRRKIVGARLRDLRGGRHLTLKDVAEKTSLTPAYISYLEKGERGFRLNTLLALCDALGVSRMEQATLLSQAGFTPLSTSPSTESAHHVWSEGLSRVLKQAATLVDTPARQTAFLSDVARLLQRHRRLNATVRKVLVPIGGWHVHLLSIQSIRTMVEGVVEEADAAKIRAFGIVAPQSLPKSLVADLRRAHPESTFHPIEQDPSSLGLGPSISAGKAFLGEDSAFAVALPDIQLKPDERSSLLKRLVSVYEARRCSVLAVRRATRHRYVRKGAVVRLSDESSNDVRPITAIEYRELSPPNYASEYYAFGRYVLTEGVFDVLAGVAPDNDGFIRLGAVVDKLLERETVHGVVFESTEFYSFALPQELLKAIVDNLTSDRNEEKLIATLDALSVQIAPWGQDASTFDYLIETLATIPDKPDAELLATLSAKLGALAEHLRARPFPFNFWASCIASIIQDLSLPRNDDSDEERVRISECRKHVTHILDFAEQGHKTRISQELWRWQSTFEKARRLRQQSAELSKGRQLSGRRRADA